MKIAAKVKICCEDELQIQHNNVEDVAIDRAHRIGR